MPSWKKLGRKHQGYSMACEIYRHPSIWRNQQGEEIPVPTSALRTADVSSASGSAQLSSLSLVPSNNPPLSCCAAHGGRLRTRDPHCPILRHAQGRGKGDGPNAQGRMEVSHVGRYHRLPKRCAGLRASALWKVTHELLCPRRTAAPFSPPRECPKPPATTFLFSCS